MGWREWQDRDASFVKRRYDSIAGLITFFEWLLFMPRGFRAKAAAAMDLKAGQCALEIGCGTGRNLPYLRESLGERGRVYGVDLSEGMLERARALCRKREWRNVELAGRRRARFDGMDGNPA